MTGHTITRISLRLPAQMLAAIDAQRVQRPGAVSRNTWIAEAIAERLSRLNSHPQHTEPAPHDPTKDLL